MNQDHKTAVNNHLRHNASSDTEDQVRERRRMAERENARQQEQSGQEQNRQPGDRPQQESH